MEVRHSSTTLKSLMCVPVRRRKGRTATDDERACVTAAGTCMRIYVYTCVWMCVCVCTCVRSRAGGKSAVLTALCVGMVRTFTSLFVFLWHGCSLYICEYVYEYAHERVCVRYVCMYVYICVYVCMYIGHKGKDDQTRVIDEGLYQTWLPGGFC